MLRLLWTSFCAICLMSFLLVLVAGTTQMPTGWRLEYENHYETLQLEQRAKNWLVASQQGHLIIARVVSIYVAPPSFSQGTDPDMIERESARIRTAAATQPIESEGHRTEAQADQLIALANAIRTGVRLNLEERRRWLAEQPNQVFLELAERAAREKLGGRSCYAFQQYELPLGAFVSNAPADDTGTIRVHWWSIGARFWLLSVLTSVPPIMWFLQRTIFDQRRTRARLGLCLGCGYDLRASIGRCPECGRAFDASAPLNPSP